MKKRNLKKMLIVGCALFSFFCPKLIFAEETSVPEDDTIEITDNVVSTEILDTETETSINDDLSLPVSDATTTISQNNSDTQICTINIRCYPQQEIYDYQETIFCSLYPVIDKSDENNDENLQSYNINLNELNNYRDSVNVAPGKYYMVATVSGNNGYFRFYMSENNNELNCLADQPVSVACAYGDEDFINNIKGYLPVADIYKDETTTTLLQKTPIQTDESTEQIMLIDNNTEEESATENDVTIIPPLKEDAEKAKQDKWIVPKLSFAIIILLLLFFIIHKRKNRMN